MSATKYKVGYVVRVRNDLGDGKYGGVYTADEMMLFRGKTITIERVITGYEGLLDDYNGHYESEGWNWTDEMLEDSLAFADNDIESRCNDNEAEYSETSESDLLNLYHTR